MKQPADMKKVGLFIDTWYPMVDGVIKVVDNYARRLMQYCDVVVFCPATRGYSKAEDNKLPYKVVRCSSLPLINNDYDIPMSALDPNFLARANERTVKSMFLMKLMRPTKRKTVVSAEIWYVSLTIRAASCGSATG